MSLPFGRSAGLLLLLTVGLITAACGQSSTGNPTTAAVAAETSVVVTELAGEAPETTIRPSQPETRSCQLAAPVGESPNTATPEATSPPQELLADPGERLPVVAQVTAIWETDWTRSTIDLGELFLGLPRSDPRDGIPPIDEPRFQSVAEASEWLEDGQPGVLVLIGEHARFYPLGIMTQHEIVNDLIGDTPVAITYCPLCNTALAFDRRVAGEEVRLGVSGLLRNSDLVMWDDLTDSLWQQATGVGIVGEYAGVSLTRVPSAIISFGGFAGAYPEGCSLSPDTGFGRSYISNPYEGYSSRSQPIGAFFPGEPDPRFPALERVVGVTEGGVTRAYPFSVLNQEVVVNDFLGDSPVAVFWGGDTLDALDSGRIADSRAIGTGVAYLAQVDGRALTFTSNGEVFLDDQTGSTWTLQGQAVEGPLSGEHLDIAIHANEFWFAWAAFFPNGEVYQGASS